MIKIFTSLFPSDVKSVFVWHLTHKILSFEFYPKDVSFECKFRISRSAIVHVQNCPTGLQRIWSRIRWRRSPLPWMTSKTRQLKIAACKRSLLYMQNASLKVRNSRAAYWVTCVHTHCIFKPVSLWCHLILDPALRQDFKVSNGEP